MKTAATLSTEIANLGETEGTGVRGNWTKRSPAHRGDRPRGICGTPVQGRPTLATPEDTAAKEHRERKDLAGAVLPVSLCSLRSFAANSGSTDEAIALGRAIRGDAVHVGRLRTLGAAAAERARRCLAERNHQCAIVHAAESQFYREAVEAATLTGGVGEFLQRELSEAAR